MLQEEHRVRREAKSRGVSALDSEREIPIDWDMSDRGEDFFRCAMNASLNEKALFMRTGSH
jgi:hypothetical protein